jgi:hypothetical protein
MNAFTDFLVSSSISNVEWYTYNSDTTISTGQRALMTFSNLHGSIYADLKISYPDFSFDYDSLSAGLYGSGHSISDWAQIDTYIRDVRSLSLLGSYTAGVKTSNVLPSIDNLLVEYTGYVKCSTSSTLSFNAAADDDLYIWLGDAALDANKNSLTYTNAIAYDRYLNSPTGASNGTYTFTADEYVPIRIIFGENAGGEWWYFTISSVAFGANLTTLVIGQSVLTFRASEFLPPV